jgi:hypothetical protein
MKTLLLVGAGYGLPNRDGLPRIEKQDLHPRVSLFPDVLNSDIFDEEFLRRVHYIRKIIYRLLPLWFGQITEAYIKRKDYNAIITWFERLGIAYAALLKLLCTRVPHVTLMYSMIRPSL